MRELIYELKGLSCANCAAKIEEDIGKLDGVSSAHMSFAVQKLKLQLEEGTNADYVLAELKKTVHDKEPDIQVIDVGNGGITPSKGHSIPQGLKRDALFLAAGILLFSAGLALGKYQVAGLALLVAAWLLSGANVFAAAAGNILKGHVFDENFLMSAATLGAVATGQFSEAAAVMLFYRAGVLLQSLAVERSRRSIKALLDLRPDYANLITDTGFERTRPSNLKIGDRILVRPGERIPLDSIVEEGESFVDTSALTGEPVPRRTVPGDTVYGGCINKNGLLRLAVQKTLDESEVSRILELVENAASKKAKVENFITRFARYYTPAVVISAVLVALLPPLISGSLDFTTWIYRALIFLVVSCPCALVVSIPLTYFAGLGKASSRGILIKGGSFLDALGRVKTVVFDKTGTLTQGVFSVNEIHAKGMPQEKLLEYAAMAEAGSSHPIAESILRAYGKTVDSALVEKCEETVGMGVAAKTAEGLILAGSLDFVRSRGVLAEIPLNISGTIVHVALDEKYIGFISISDRIKDDADKAIQELRREGVDRICMLTGDARNAAESVAEILKLDSVCYSLLPHQKLERLENIRSETKGSLVFAGDGINDAPVLARADIGVSMGALGSDAAIEASDVVLMTDEPSRLAEAVRIARKTRRLALQNIVLAIAVKVAVLALGTTGNADMWEAVFADVGVTLLAVFNALRVLRA